MLTATDVVKAHEVLKNVVERTPLEFDRYLSEKYQATIYLKRENMQKVRSFKLRGAYYAIHQLSDEDKANGVVCASAGNHAQGVAYTCNEMKISATIFMPITTPQQKITQVKFFGGAYVDIQLVGDTFDASSQAAQEFTKAQGRTFIPPFDDDNVQAGQGTVAYEIYEQAKDEGVDFDSILVPVGGGGLIAGVATYMKDVSPDIRVIGVESNGARSMRAAFDKGYPVK
ncbi:pyridoxal-phosphate dependent enzyme, partial [Streptococcus sobrinus]